MQAPFATSFEVERVLCMWSQALPAEAGLRRAPGEACASALVSLQMYLPKSQSPRLISALPPHLGLKRKKETEAANRGAAIAPMPTKKREREREREIYIYIYRVLRWNRSRQIFQRKIKVALE